MFRSDRSQRCGRRTPMLARSFCKLSESAPQPVAPHCPLLVFLGLWRVPHPGLSLNPTSSMRPPRVLQPHFHIPRHCVDYLEKKRSLPIPLGVPESPGLQQRQGPGTCSFPKYKPHLCTMDPEVGPARKGCRADKSWSCTWLCSHLVPAAQGL